MVVVVIGLEGWLAPRFSELERLVPEVAVGGAVYWLALLALRARVYRDTVDLVRSQLAADSPLAIKLAHGFNRVGVYATHLRRSLWIHGRRMEDFETAAAVIGAAHSAFPSAKLLFTSSEPDTCARLRARYPGSKAVAPPGGPATARFFRCLNPVGLLWLDSPAAPSNRSLRAARQRGIPIVEVPLGVEAGRVVRELEPLLAPAQPGEGEGSHSIRWMRQIAETSPGRWLASRRGRRRIPDWDSLRLRLGCP
jgi:hypothetical protein